jgi:hypothetical protein
MTLENPMPSRVSDVTSMAPLAKLSAAATTMRGIPALDSLLSLTQHGEIPDPGPDCMRTSSARRPRNLG